MSVDFIEGLPPSDGKHVIFVVVDQLSKYANFVPLSHPYSASQLAQVFIDDILKLHGMLAKSTVCDCDVIFTCAF